MMFWFKYEMLLKSLTQKKCSWFWSAYSVVRLGRIAFNLYNRILVSNPMRVSGFHSLPSDTSAPQNKGLIAHDIMTQHTNPNLRQPRAKYHQLPHSELNFGAPLVEFLLNSDL